MPQAAGISPLPRAAANLRQAEHHESQACRAQVGTSFARIANWLDSMRGVNANGSDYEGGAGKAGQAPRVLSGPRQSDAVYRILDGPRLPPRRHLREPCPRRRTSNYNQ